MLKKKSNAVRKRQARRRPSERPDHPFQVLPAYRFKHLVRFIDFAYSEADAETRLADFKDMRANVFARASELESPLPATASDAAPRIAALQESLRRGFERLLRREKWELPPLTMVASQHDGGFASSYRGSPENMFIHETWDRLRGLPAWRLQRCPAEDCERLFVKTKKALYCPVHASAQARAARYRAKLPERLTPEQIRERRHRHYVARVQKLKGKAAAKRVRRFRIRAPASKRAHAITQRLAREAVENIHSREE